MSSTDSADGQMSFSLSPPKKRLKKNHLDVSTKEMILKIYQRDVQENSTSMIDEVVRNVAKKVGVSSRSVYNIVREYKNTHQLSAPKTNKNRNNSFDLLDDFYKNGIRLKVHQFYFRNEFPTIDKVLKEVNEDNDLPDFKRTTFYKFLKKLNFKYQRCGGRNSMLIDRDDIIVWRRDYLRRIKTYRNENRKIYYVGETWVNVGHPEFKMSVNDSVTALGQAFLDGKNPSDNGDRLIICDIGSEDGFVPDALWAFESKKDGTSDEEMDGISFENWFLNTLSRLEDNSVIVVDNASYHCRKVETIPTKAFSKTHIQDWLRSKNIDFSDTMLKVELLALVNEQKATYNKYIIDEMAKSQNKIVLRVPPYHCELNPIELIWADMKTYVACNTTYTFTDLKNVFYEALATISPKEWKKYIQYVQETVEQRLWDLDNIIEAHIEPNADNSGSSSSSE